MVDKSDRNVPLGTDPHLWPGSKPTIKNVIQHHVVETPCGVPKISLKHFTSSSTFKNKTLPSGGKKAKYWQGNEDWQGKEV